MIIIDPLYLTIFCLAVSFLTLCSSILILSRRQKAHAAQVARLEDVIQRMSRELIASNARIARNHRTLKHMGDRQDTLECRATSGPRIESAVRVARQGAASEAVLRDLGLSDSEASLLLRLHTGQTETVVSEAAAIMTEPVAARAEDQARAQNKDIRPQSQAASLAALLSGSSGAAAVA